MVYTELPQKEVMPSSHDEYANIAGKKRELHHNYCTKSWAFPDKSMTVIVDGMDQAKINIPNTNHC